MFNEKTMILLLLNVPSCDPTAPLKKVGNFERHQRGKSMAASATVLACLFASSQSARVMAADLSDSASRIARDARRDSRAARELILESLQLAQPTIKLTLGGAYDKDENDSKTLNIPFDWSYKTTGSDWWKFQLAGDGFSRITTPSMPTVNGVADIKFNVIRQIAPSALATVGGSVPTKGDIGTQSYTQHGRLLLTNDVGKSWSYVAFFDVKHYNNSSEILGAYRQSGYTELDYNIDKDRTILVNLLRTRRAGAGASTDIGLEFDSPSPWVGFASAISIGRGVTPGFRHTSVEIDMTHTF